MHNPYLVVTCNSAGNSLTLHGMNADGRLSDLGECLLPDVGEPNGAYPMTVSADRRRLYVAFRGMSHEVLSFAVDAAHGTLELLGRAPLSNSMAYIAVSSDGRYLLSASYGGGCVSVNPIGTNGVAMAPTDTQAAGGKMHCCLPLPGSNTFLATSLADDAILSFRVDDAGTLQRLPDRAISAPGAAPRHLIRHPSGRFCLLITEMAATVLVYGLDGVTPSPGALQSISTLPPNWQGDGWGADIRQTPDGRYCYASDRKASTIAGFAVDAAGRSIRSIGHTQVAYWPRAFNISPDGRFLINLGEMSDRMEVFAIDRASGALDLRDAAATGRGPSWVEVFIA